MKDIFGGPTLEDLHELWRKQDAPQMATWQCPGCGRIYTVLTNSCSCQMDRWVTGGTTIATSGTKAGK